MDPLLTVSSLSVAYGSDSVIEDLDLSVRKGEIVSLVGRSGVGKSTLLNALLGSVVYSGKAVVPPGLGVVFQDYSVFPWMTVSQNILFGIADRPESEKAAVLVKYLALTGLQDFAERYPDELSGGQLQRVAIARAFAPKPSLLLMDEPFAALDMHTRFQTQEWFQSVCSQEGKTVLLVTHLIDEAILLSDRILVLVDKGTLEDYDVDLPRPRNQRMVFEKAFLDLKKKIAGRLERSSK